MSRPEVPDYPIGIGSIIRVMFKDTGEGETTTFYVGVAPGLWVEYGGDATEFDWRDLVDIIKHDEADVFEVVYEGFRGRWRDETQHHVKDWIWGEGL